MIRDFQESTRIFTFRNVQRRLTSLILVSLVQKGEIDRVHQGKRADGDVATVTQIVINNVQFILYLLEYITCMNSDYYYILCNITSQSRAEILPSRL